MVSYPFRKPPTNIGILSMNTPRPSIMADMYVSSPSPLHQRGIFTPLSHESDSEWTPESEAKSEESESESESEESETEDSPDSSVKSAYGFHPSPRKTGDLIPNQAAFLLIMDIFMEDISKSAGEERVRMVTALFIFLLQPQFAPYHLGRTKWRQLALAKCTELLMDPKASPELCVLCRRFQELYG